jgi:hypothetical protein
MTPNQTQFLVALRSGNYEQTWTGLHDTCGSCCLGVAAQEFLTPQTVVKEVGGRIAYDGEQSFAPKYVIKALGLFSDIGSGNAPHLTSLLELNDSGKTFSEIADIIEANPEAYFNAM